MLLEPAPAATATGCLCATAAAAAASDAASPRLTAAQQAIIGLARHWRRNNLRRGGAPSGGQPQMNTDTHGCPFGIIRVYLCSSVASL